MGSKNWDAGDVVNASDFNAFLANQVVMVFADATARDAGFGGTGEPVLAEGMVCYLSDVNAVQVYNGSAWVAIADLDVMVVDTVNGWVGIGTASPQKLLHVEEGNSGATAGATQHLVVESDTDCAIAIASGATSNGYLRFIDSGSNSIGGFNYDHNDDSLKIRTAGTDHITIDGTGRVINVSQPSFHAYFNTYWTETTSSTVLVFDTTAYNIGSHYSTSTGRFTAPVAGKYLFTFHAFLHTTYDNDTDSYFGLSKNGSGWATTNHGVEGQDGGQSISAVISLAASDYVSVLLSSGSISGAGGVYNSFTGHLLG